MTETLVSAQTCDAFPVAVCIAIAGLAALFVGWQWILRAAAAMDAASKKLGAAVKWERFCVACGGVDSADTVLKAAEATVDAAADVMMEAGLRALRRKGEHTSDFRLRLARFNEDKQ